MERTDSLMGRVLRSIRLVIGVGIGLYGATATLFTMLRLVLTEQNQLIAIFNTFGQLLWLIAILLLVLALILRLWRVSVFLLVPVVAFFLTYGPMLMSRTITPKGSERVTVATYNLLWHKNSDIDAEIAIIRAMDADIVLMQELGLESSVRLEAELLDEYPYQRLDAQGLGIRGQGILSRYPIVDSEYWMIGSGFGQQRAEIDFNGTPLVVYNVHLHQPLLGTQFINVAQRNAEITYFLERIAEEKGRVIFAGDMNMVELNEGYSMLRETLRDAYWDAGQGFGWTFRYFQLPPLLRLDYVFYDSFGLEALNAQTWPQNADSDHHPVVVELGLFDPTASYP